MAQRVDGEVSAFCVVKMLILLFGWGKVKGMRQCI